MFVCGADLAQLFAYQSPEVDSLVIKNSVAGLKPSSMAVRKRASGRAKRGKGKQIGTGELRVLEPKTSCHLGHGAQAALACCGITCQLDSGEAVTQGQDRDISGGIYMVTPPPQLEN